MRHPRKVPSRKDTPMAILAVNCVMLTEPMAKIASQKYAKEDVFIILTKYVTSISPTVTDVIKANVRRGARMMKKIQKTIKEAPARWERRCQQQK